MQLEPLYPEVRLFLYPRILSLGCRSKLLSVALLESHRTWETDGVRNPLILYSITAKPRTAEGVKLLYAKVMKKEKPADSTGGYKYHVALVDVTPHGRALLNDSLVAWGLASQSEEKKQHLKALDFSHLVFPVKLDLYESEEDEDDCNEAWTLNDMEITFEENWDSTKALSPRTGDLNNSAQSYSSDISSKSEASLVPAMFFGFNFDEVTEDEIMEFFEKAMENDKFQEGKNSSVSTAVSTEGKNGGTKRICKKLLLICTRHPVLQRML